MKSKKGIIIFAVIIVLAAAGVVTYNILNRFQYNEDGAMGNTNGNMYNGGLFCEYEGDVYFSNPYDDGALYMMNDGGSDFEKVCDDDSSYICIYNNQIYYKKFNSGKNKDKLFQRTLYGIVRLKKGHSSGEMIHNGKVDSMVLCGNYVYYRYYDDETLFSLRKAKIDGEEDVLIDEGDYRPIAAYNGKLYFTNVSGNNNLMTLDTKDDTISTVRKGNFYMPDIYNGNLYYIDADNGKKLSRMNLSTGEVTVLSDDTVINYNMSGEYGVIYYQVENSTDDHRLCRMSLDGSGEITVAKGDYCNIGITKKYTYFYYDVGEIKVMYRTPTLGNAEVREFVPKVIAD